MPQNPPKPEQDIMNEGPGLRQVGRETTAVGNEVMHNATGAKAGGPARSSAPMKVDKVKVGPYGSKPGEKRYDVSDMTKPLPSYKHGTDYVPKTGPAILHKGEKVVPKEKNMDAYAKIHEGEKKPKKEIKRIIHTKMHDGKVHTTHEHHHPEHHGDEHFAHSTGDEMKAHMDAHAGMPDAEGSAPNPGDAEQAQLTASPAPMQPGAGATPGM